MSPAEVPLHNIVRDPARLKVNEPLSRHTTFRIGGPADFFVEVVDRAELRGVLAVATEHGLPIWMLGNGSNLLVSDQGVRGIVLVLGGELARKSISGNRITAGAGYNLPKLAADAARLGLGGLSFACAIPGTVGAGLAINAGAHGGDMSKVVESALVMWPDGTERRLTPEDIGFGYRTTRLQGTAAIVTEVTFSLQPTAAEILEAEIKKYLEHRRRTQPLNQPNCGSVFKNPPGHFAGRLIEETGCKGWREGDAQVSEKHANFIVNLGSATARNVTDLMQRVRERVQREHGVWLEPEVRIWGPNPFYTGGGPGTSDK